MTIHYTPGSPNVPDPLIATPDFPGAVVLLVAGAGEREWAARTAVDLAAAWAHSGRRVVLADLHLEDPFLHEVVGEENLEGVVDVFLYGASLARSARPLRGRGFHLVTAGTYTDEPDAVNAHPRWPKLIEGFRDAQASLLLFAPAELDVVRGLGAHATDVVLLGAPPQLGEAVPGSARTHPSLGPPAGVGAAGSKPLQEPLQAPVEDAGEDADPREEMDPEAEAPTDEPPVTSPGEAAQVDVVLTSPDDVALPPPPEPRRRRRIRAGVSPFTWVVLTLAALVMVGVLVASERPELLDPLRERLSGGSAAGEALPVATAGTRGATPLGDTLALSVQIKAYNSLRAARQQVGVEQRRHRDVPFVISPELVSDLLYYKVYAGMTADTAEAVSLRRRLVASGSLDESDALSGWPVVHTTALTFLLGEEGDAGAARAGAEALTERGVPAYAVRLPYSDGSSRWRVYGGAFADTLRAEGMRQLLEDAGVEGRLVPRIGTLEAEG